MSGNKKIVEEKTKVGWIYHLNKQQLIEELEKRHVTIGDNDKFDDLRRILVEAKNKSKFKQVVKANNQTENSTTSKIRKESFESK